MAEQHSVSIGGIWLRQEGGRITVDVEMPDGTLHQVIRETWCDGGTISHCVTSHGIEAIAAGTECVDDPSAYAKAEE